MKLTRRLASSIIEYLTPLTVLKQPQLITNLVLCCSSLGIPLGSRVAFAAVGGSCGSISLMGSTCPTFRYVVFDKKIMQFVEVFVEVSRPNRIEYICRTFNDPEGPSQELEMKDQYKKPFLLLCSHISRYFPFSQDTKHEPIPFKIAKVQAAIQSPAGLPRQFYRENSKDWPGECAHKINNGIENSPTIF